MFRRKSSISNSGATPVNQDASEIDAVPALASETNSSSRRKSSLGSIKLSASFRSLSVKSNKKRTGSIPEDEHHSLFGLRFFNLPRELQGHIICTLDFQDILRLRYSCSLLKSLVDNFEGDIVRYHIKNYLDPYTLTLFDPGDLRGIRLEYLSAINHRQVICSKLATYVANYVRDEIYRMRSAEAIEIWASKHLLLRKFLQAPLITLFKFFEEIRPILINTPYEPPDPMNPDVNPVEKSYIEAQLPENHLLDTYYTFELLIGATTRRWRPPTYAGGFERTLRGWSRSPPTDIVYLTLFYIGGLREVARTWQPGRPFAARRRKFDRAVENLMYIGNSSRSSWTNRTTSNTGSGSRAPSVLSSDAESSASRMPLPRPGSDELQTLMGLLPQLRLPNIFAPAAREVILEKNLIEGRDRIRHFSWWLVARLDLRDGEEVWGSGESDSEQEDAQLSSSEEEGDEDESEAGQSGHTHGSNTHIPSPAYDSPVWTSVI